MKRLAWITALVLLLLLAGLFVLFLQRNADRASSVTRSERHSPFPPPPTEMPTPPNPRLAEGPAEKTTTQVSEQESVQTGRLTVACISPASLELNEVEVIVLTENGRIEASTTISGGAKATFDPIAAGRKFAVVVPKEGDLSPAWVHSSVSPGLETQVEVRLEGATVISGKLVDTAGKAVSNADVIVSVRLNYSVSADKDRTYSSMVVTSANRAGPTGNAWTFSAFNGQLSQHVRSDTEGRFQVKGFGSAPARVSVKYGGRKEYEQWVVPSKESYIVVPY